MAPNPTSALVSSQSAASTQRLQKQARDQLSRYVVETLSKLGLSGSSGGLVSSVARHTPAMWTVVKALIGLLFLVNARSWPLVWHVRIWYWAIAKRMEYRIFRWSTAFSSKAVRAKKEDEWVERTLGGMGKHPFDYVSVYHSWASLDESDFNMHLSNSSYAKTLDAARFKVAMEMFVNFFRGGGWLPLAATQYHFICEIPILANYEVRSRIGGWDEKWFYVVSKFVMPANKSKKKVKAAVSKGRKPAASASATTSGSASPTSSKEGGNPDGMPSLRTPSCADDVNSALPSGAATPFISPSTSSTSSSSYAAVIVNGLDAVDASLQSNGKVTENIAGNTPSHGGQRQIKIAELDEFDVEEADGAQVHTVAISRCCFKVGRITVPPRLVFALCGLSAEKPVSSSSSSTSTSGTTYPPHWDALKKTLNPTGRVGPYGTYDPRALAKLMKGGWKDVSVHQEGHGDVKESDEDEKRWWEAAWRAEGFDEAMRARVERLGRRL
ncbi:hypothetical protein BKA70DRAFT_1392694 [Coprinopsis sp. MPI-PUGE-AT-0042]|nr:hypothetical protein BKA70DRAFT_1392694 [Coprinopsis sp. MPI-PUGE-AT-0042]